MFGLSKNKKITFDSIDPVKFRGEDRGKSLIADAEGIDYDDTGESGLFVRIHSWDETKEHPLTNRLQGKKVRITIEILD